MIVKFWNRALMSAATLGYSAVTLATEPLPDCAPELELRNCAVQVPEPSTLPILAIGLAAIALALWVRRSRLQACARVDASPPSSGRSRTRAA